MKVQFAIINPHSVSLQATHSSIFGIASGNEPIADHDLKYLVLADHGDCSSAFLFPSGENLMNRAKDSSKDINHLLTSPIWNRLECEDGLGAQVAFVAAEPIEPDSGHAYHYLFFGTISGESSRLSALSGQLLEAHFPDALIDKGADVPLIQTGRLAEHITGSHFSSLLKQTIWGFGSRRAGLVDPKGLSEARRHFKIVENFVKTRTIPDDPDFWALKKDTVYQDYLIARNELSPLAFNYWETSEEREINSRLPVKALLKSLLDEGPSA